MINLTDAAVNQIEKLQSEEDKQGHVLRVAVVGGGCSGMSYKLDFDTKVGEKDKVFEYGSVKVAVDPKSYLFLKGMTLDFSAGLNGKGFEFSNPNASKSCGCGSSFAV